MLMLFDQYLKDMFSSSFLFHTIVSRLSLRSEPLKHIFAHQVLKPFTVGL